MSTMPFILAEVAPTVNTETLYMNSIGWYVAGVLIALFLLAYLMYSLIKPEKF
jgi:K+-transporting ATPase KdpF subunit